MATAVEVLVGLAVVVAVGLGVAGGVAVGVRLWVGLGVAVDVLVLVGATEAVAATVGVGVFVFVTAEFVTTLNTRLVFGVLKTCCPEAGHQLTPLSVIVIEKLVAVSVVQNTRIPANSPS
ncbi:MAG: hypothetical protein A2700_00960 [Candidatus Blackburnbacteria bacterium RIFCSPHIGHO2_01_FULL_44_64]|uniref:Uncharacterized protein n=1 Tax=Candidatus Gottesmanbacteria bacterium GW2011_GWA1_47_8 TaxID=1618438 RepID=A0A0G1TGD5_9BACT|nr:MAG: hypothetical protein UY08_C0008G0006 [Candidatus Gottesmanbacteria bacterium GW2011_GWA1_47_8]OGY08393.1 MAG: hypothetical protein A2700_00960 [Candidatus Blackburnbacteria bacterium RIFCSPHIGHO2_01_FULL_44_64]